MLTLDIKGDSIGNILLYSIMSKVNDTLTMYYFLIRKNLLIRRSCVRRRLTTRDNVQEKKELSVDVSKIEVGMVINNYPSMCRLIGDRILTSGGHSKTSQLQNWKRYFEWKMQGRKFVIIEVYDTPLPEMLPSNAIYAKFMQLSLMKYLLNQPEGTYNFFSSSLMARVGLVTWDYNRDLRGGSEKYEELFGPYGEYPEISIRSAEKTTEYSYNRLLRILDDALKSLDRAAIIHYKREWAVKTTPWGEEGGFRGATKKEEIVVAKAEQEAMKKIDTTSKWYAYACRGHEMGKYMSEYIHTELPDLYGAAKWIEVVYPNPSKIYWDRVVNKITRDLKKDDPSLEMALLTDDIIVEMSKEALNKLVVNAMIREGEKRSVKAQTEINDEVYKGKHIRYNREEKYYIADPNFLREYTELINRYVSIKKTTQAEYVEKKVNKVEKDWSLLDL